ncbi:MAG: hypothetical protein ACUZ8E_12775 [Candidatus Anammoxibacter sp.]
MEQTLTKEIGFVKIDCLPHKKLLSQLDVVIEPDSEGFIARTPAMPLYGYGEDPIEAINSLKYEIETLYDDLTEDDEFTDDWLRIKEYLKGKIKEY